MKNSGDGRRVAKAEMEVQRIVAQYLLGPIKGEFAGLITVTKVMMPADLRSAKVYVSVFNSKEKMSEILENLQRQAWDIQDLINKKLRMRYVPKLTFYQDDMTEKVLKVEGLLKEIEDQRKRNKT
jgi:ribosome-binding factor A